MAKKTKYLFIVWASACICSAVAFIIIAIVHLNSNNMNYKVIYPQTKTVDVTDNYFGTEVKDPYRWLEDDNSEETAAWVKEQNKVTDNYLKTISYRKDIRKRLAELFDIPSESSPVKYGNWYYVVRNNGQQNQSVYYRKRNLVDASEEVFFDPNKLSKDGTVAVNSLSFTKDGKYVAYGLSSSGSDWVTIHVMEAETKKVLDDKIEWVKASGATWTEDGRGFYYSRFEAPKDGVYSTQNRNHKVYFHKVNTPQQDDILIFEDQAHPLVYHNGYESEDGKWIFISSSEGTSGTQIIYRNTACDEWKVLFKGYEYDYSIIEYRDNKVYVVTNDNAARYQLVRIDLNTHKKEIIIKEKNNQLDGVTVAGNNLFAHYLIDVQSKVYQYDMEGNLIREVSLPLIGSADGFISEKEENECFYSITNFTTPCNIYRYNVKTGESSLYSQIKGNFNPEDFVVEQKFYSSTDGTKVPMFICHKKDFKLDGTHLCYLYGYGGFQINILPSFSPTAILLMEQGGVYCVANIRGGCEYGEEWHKDGMLDNKQNVFDDFICGAEFLISEKYTSSQKLTIAGGSNGGLLVGACEVQRPDLFAVCIPMVGVMDMLRFHKFTIGYGWCVEYGCSDNEEQFNYLYKYSPLHNIKEGTSYPATMVITADHDDRVVPAHSFKFGATLQHCQAGDSPVLIRITSNAGHGAGMPRQKRIDMSADTFAFIFRNTETPFIK